MLNLRKKILAQNFCEIKLLFFIFYKKNNMLCARRPMPPLEVKWIDLNNIMVRIYFKLVVNNFNMKREHISTPSTTITMVY